MIRDNSFSSKVLDFIVYTVMILVLAVTLYPVLYVLASSFSSSSANDRGLVTIYPIGFNVDAYRGIFSQPTIVRSFRNSVIITAAGTTINMFFTTTYAYALSRRKLALRGLYTVAAMIPMYFSGGLIPTFLLVTNTLDLFDTWWALILPIAINTTNMIIMRSFFISLPVELEESAYLDGANDLVIFYRIMLPLSKASLFTIGLYYLVGHWNSWFSAMIYLNTQAKMPLQIILRQIVLLSSSLEQAALEGEVISGSSMYFTNYIAVKYATLVFSMAPMLMIYPFVQKFFVKGVMIGSLKG
ncbi:MAG: carbohydrate ABC transporter permease [Christensenellales bacterium]|jgi:putative aldouronate transport system permease protein